jgi:hypothetical protein
MTLSAQKVNTAGVGRHGDRRGFFLDIKTSGARSRVLRYQVQKRQDVTDIDAGSLGLSQNRTGASR